MLNKYSPEILQYLQEHPSSSSKEIHEGLSISLGYATVKRSLSDLIHDKLIEIEGKGRGTKYKISRSYSLFAPVNLDTYFEKEIDEREINKSFNFDLIDHLLKSVDIFSAQELLVLNKLQDEFKQNISQSDEASRAKELQRLAIDLSWKSSQIEGNTYSLLETERLLLEHETASGKTKDEAIMLLNHKIALDFIIKDPSYISPLSLARIEDIHSLLIKDLGINRNIRRRRVGISGTNYKPIDNEHQIRQVMELMCDLVNSKTNVFEKALLLLVLISYIQPFGDGNKRTARIMSNAVLLANDYCPISFRTVSSLDYKKAMLVFYEQNNITAMKQIFITQFAFAVKTYF